MRQNYVFGNMALIVADMRCLERLKELLSGDELSSRELLATTYLMGVKDMAQLYLKATNDKDSLEESLKRIDDVVSELLEGSDEDAEG